MTDVLFYHLTESRLEDALPPLIDKSVERGWRVAVQTREPARRDALDQHLWTFREESFLPHGTRRDGNPAAQPVYLTADDINPNEATVRFLVDGAGIGDSIAEGAGYDRIVYLFDGHDAAAVASAREQWKAVKATGCDATYWQQSPEGRWEKRA